jgi:Uma2 family endonuclease
MSHADAPRTREPAWEVARLFPDQGFWDESDYFALSERNRLVEFSDGVVEVLPMPTMYHQVILAFLYRTLLAFVEASDLGWVLFAPMKVRLRTGRFREPDLLFMLREHADRLGNLFWDGADLVMEVVSDQNRDHDLDTKRREYAEAGIAEYWIVDPTERAITVLALEPGATVYSEHGRFVTGQRATSRLLPGFAVDVAATFAVKP